MTHQQPGFGQFGFYGIFAVIAYFSCCIIALLLGSAALVFLVILCVSDTQSESTSMWIYFGFFSPLIIFILNISLIYYFGFRNIRKFTDTRKTEETHRLAIHSIISAIALISFVAFCVLSFLTFFGFMLAIVIVSMMNIAVSFWLVLGVFLYLTLSLVFLHPVYTTGFKGIGNITQM
jgi:Na+/H+ antiporter NhaC